MKNKKLVVLLSVIGIVVALLVGVIFKINENKKQEELGRRIEKQIQREQEAKEYLKDNTKASLKITSADAYFDMGFILISGTILNDGNYGCDGITIKVEYLDEFGDIVGTDKAYINGMMGINPNTTQAFSTITEVTPEIESATSFRIKINSDFKVFK